MILQMKIKKINKFVDTIINRVDKEVDKNKYVPEDFLFIFPIMKNNLIFLNRDEVKSLLDRKNIIMTPIIKIMQFCINTKLDK